MKVVVTALRVLEEITAGPPMGVSELSRRLELPKSTVQRALETLTAEGWIQQEPNGSRHWMQTPKLLVLASRGGGTALRETALPVMHQLLSRVNENIHLTIRHDDNIVVVERLESTHLVRVFDPLGITIPLHASASGKAILAHATEAGIDEYINRNLKAYTADTLTDPDSIREELRDIRSRGYAYNRGEWRSEIKGIGAPIRDRHGPPYAGLSVSIPHHRLVEKDVEALGALVVQAAMDISRAL